MNSETRELIRKTRDAIVRERVKLNAYGHPQCELCNKTIPAGGPQGDRRRFCSRACQKKWHWNFGRPVRSGPRG